MTISSSKENTGRPRHDLAAEKCNISALHIPNEPLTRSRGLDDCVYDTFESFWQTNECNEIG